jgi:hypothetical protein
MPIPGGASSPLYVYHGGTWHRRTSPDYIDNSGTWLPQKLIYRAVSTAVNPSTLLEETTWEAIVDYRSPAGLSVAGVTIAKSHAAPTYSANLSWTVITDPSDIRYVCNVQYAFHNVTTSTDDVGSVDQSVGIVRSSVAWALGDEVYGSVNYVNDNGSGTVVDSSHIFLGP